MTKIPVNEVTFHPLSYGDLNGRLFTWRGELFRGIAHERAQFYAALFNDGTMKRLIDRGLFIESELTDLVLPNFGLIVKHRRLPFVTFPFEWSGQMLKAAALKLIELKLELSQFNLTTQDAHPWNILFDGTNPKFVDLGSIIAENGKLDLWQDNGEFLRFMFYPLQGIEKGNIRIVRSLLHDYIVGIDESDADLIGHRRGVGFRGRARDALRKSKQFLPAALHESVRKILKTADRNISGRAPRLYENHTHYLERLYAQVQGIRIPAAETPWSNYYDSFPSFESSPDWNSKHQSVHKILTEIRPTTLLDVGSNRGWYSQLAAKLGSTVVAMDVDENCVDQLYIDARKLELSIQPLVIDICSPSPGLGPSNQAFAPATERLRSEMVLGLAVTHHMVFGRNLRFEQIADAFADMSAKYLLIEFVPSDDIYVSQWRPGAVPLVYPRTIQDLPRPAF